MLGIIFAAHYGSYILLVIGAVDGARHHVLLVARRDAESRTPGLHSPVVRLGLRYGMMLFIASEVMFFVGFFWAYFNFALFPDTQGNGQTVWPPSNIHTFDPFHLPFLNTMILLLSGTHDHLGAPLRCWRTTARAWSTGLGLTILLGTELHHLPGDRILRTRRSSSCGGGIYPSMFFLATGFHGFHVIVGTCFLIVCWFRARAGQFTPQRHFGFEAAAWYWHFVDVVWLFLFVCIYWWGAGRSSRPSRRRWPNRPPRFRHAALRCRCPRCGRGRLFRGLLDVRDRCAVCGLDLRAHDAGDGPAVGGRSWCWAPSSSRSAFWVEFRFSPPLWVHAVLWPVVTIPGWRS